MRRTYWMSVEQVCTIIVALMLASCVRVHGQFGVEQPFFFTRATSAEYPAANLLHLLDQSDFGVSNNVIGLSLTNGANADYWYHKVTPNTNVIRLKGVKVVSTFPVYYTNGGNGYPYVRTHPQSGSQSYLAADESANAALTNGFTVFLVIRPYLYGGSDNGIATLRAYGSFGWNYVYMSAASVPTNSAVFTLDAGSTIFTGTTTWSTNTWSLLTIGYRTDATFLKLNGVDVISGGAGNNPRFAYEHLVYGFISADCIGADWQEMRIYAPTLATNDLVTIESLLKAKYSIP